MDKMLAQVKCFLLDMDGTVYLDGVPLEGAIDAVERMKKQGRVIFLTNNSSLAKSDYVEKLNRIGFKVTEENVFTSGNATVEFLQQNYNGKRIYLFGNDKLVAEFKEGGIVLERENPDLIVVGFHTSFDYDELTHLCDLIREGVPYMCTHPDVNCPTARGFKPDVGSFIKLIESSTGVSPFLICGKPNKPIGDSIKRITGLDSKNIAMVGDRLCTDIQFGINNGFVSVLVLSGEAKEEDIVPFGQKIDVILPSIAEWDK